MTEPPSGRAARFSITLHFHRAAGTLVESMAQVHGLMGDEAITGGICLPRISIRAAGGLGWESSFGSQDLDRNLQPLRRAAKPAENADFDR